jgi:hypothetical protein
MCDNEGNDPYRRWGCTWTQTEKVGGLDVAMNPPPLEADEADQKRWETKGSFPWTAGTWGAAGQNRL